MQWTDITIKVKLPSVTAARLVKSPKQNTRKIIKLLKITYPTMDYVLALQSSKLSNLMPKNVKVWKGILFWLFLYMDGTFSSFYDEIEHALNWKKFYFLTAMVWKSSFLVVELQLQLNIFGSLGTETSLCLSHSGEQGGTPMSQVRQTIFSRFLLIRCLMS